MRMEVIRPLSPVYHEDCPHAPEDLFNKSPAHSLSNSVLCVTVSSHLSVIYIEVV